MVETVVDARLRSIGIYRLKHAQHVHKMVSVHNPKTMVNAKQTGISVVPMMNAKFVQGLQTLMEHQTVIMVAIAKFIIIGIKVLNHAFIVLQVDALHHLCMEPALQDNILIKQLTDV